MMIKFCIGLTLTIAVACGHTTDNQVVHDNIESELLEKYPGSSHFEFNTTRKDIEVSFQRDNYYYKAVFLYKPRQASQWLYTSREMSMFDLPEAVSKTLSTEYPFAAVLSAVEREVAEKGVLYVLDCKEDHLNYIITISNDGQLIDYETI